MNHILIIEDDKTLSSGSGLDFLKELHGYSRKPVILLTANDSELISIGEYLFDFEKMIFTKGGMPIELSKTEQKLLRILAVNRGRTIPRGELVDRVWSTFFL